jgi:hypothetical protein
MAHRLYIHTLHRSELQVITVPLLISTIHRLPQNPLSLFPACCVFNSRSLATALTVEILQFLAHTSLLSGEYPSTELLSTVDSTMVSSFLSLPCKAPLYCQPSPELSLTNQLLYFTSAGLEFSLYSLGADSTENTFLLFLRACSFPRERVYRAVA